MDAFLPIIRIGVAVAPFIIIGLTIPFIFRSYHQYGHISVTQWVIVISFALYLFMVVAFAIFPLPPIEQVRNLTTPTMQLVPFKAFSEFMAKSGFVWNNPATYWPAMQSFTFLEPILNILFFMPLGMYLHYYFGRNWWQTILISFGLSLLLEVTQLTGLFWVYPRPYRLFDVDDLIMNTLGGWLGYVVSPLLTWWLPSREELLKHNYQKGESVGYLRRFIALAFDWILIAFLTVAVKTIWSMLNIPALNIDPNLQMLYTYIGIVVGYFIVLPALTRGRTVGKWLVQIAISSPNHKGVNVLKLILRQVLLYGLLVPSIVMGVYYLLNFNTTIGAVNLSNPDPLALAKIIIPFVVVIVFLMDFIYKRIRSKETPRLLYENWSGTEEVNTIDQPRKMA